MERLPRIETIAIGDELLTGKISDSNSTFFADTLFACGLRLSRQTVIADDMAQIISELGERAKHAEYLVVFGGLGPTTDDLTVDAACKLTNDVPAVDPVARKKMESLYRTRGREITENALRQVRYPSRARVLPNEEGLAPGFVIEHERASIFFLPGVPTEMRGIIERGVLPEIRDRTGRKQLLVSHTWRCLGIWESALQDLVAPVEKTLPAGCWLGFRTSFPENHLTLYHPPAAEATVRPAVEQLRKLLAEYCYSESGLSLEETLVETLKVARCNLVVVESCTGGLVASRITRVPGSGDVFWGGFTSYQIAAKAKMLGVTLDRPEDAVSRDCTLRLALAAREISGCEIAAAITGYMGPSGGTEADPIGTCYTAVVSAGGRREDRFVIHRKERERKQYAASATLLNEVRLAIPSASAYSLSSE